MPANPCWHCDRLVVVGDLIGSGEAQERGIVGETPNHAARLQGVAGWDLHPLENAALHGAHPERTLAKSNSRTAVSP